MKLRALCDAQLSAKSTITNLLHSASSSRSSKGLGDSSTTGAGSTEGSKLGMPLLLKHTDIAKGPDRQVMAEESKTVKDFLQNGMFSAAKNSTAVPAPMAECQTAGQKQQLSTVAKICSRPDSSAATKALQNPGMDQGMVLVQHGESWENQGWVEVVACSWLRWSAALQGSLCSSTKLVCGTEIYWATPFHSQIAFPTRCQYCSLLYPMSSSYEQARNTGRSQPQSFMYQVNIFYKLGCWGGGGGLAGCVSDVMTLGSQ